MCNQAKIERWARSGLSRREFGAIAGAATLAACSSPERAEQADREPPVALTEESVSFATADGTMDAFFVHPDGGNHPAVILWPDIASIREAKRDMARRLASEGYAVLVLNPYYRDVVGEQFADFAAFISAGGFEQVGPWRAKLDGESIQRDAAAAIAWLDRQNIVDTARGIGAEGYCMGGPFTVWTAAAVPGRVKAAASFHGGGLVREDYPLSPHKLLGETQASFLVAIARDDDAEAPGDKTQLREAADAAGREAVINVYAGDHGWTVPDSPAYTEAAAEEAWVDKLALYRRAL